MGKKVLIVYAHQSSCSFNAEAKNVAVDFLKSHDCTVEVSDLYAMKFKATATAEDISGRGEVKDDEPFHYAEETKCAWEQGKLSADIIEEQRKLTEAHLIIFQFPMYWFGVPAIMKGWFDRVLTLGYAYSEETPYKGVFKDKKAMLSFTTGSHKSMFGANGINGDIDITLWPLQNGILHFCGFQVLSPQVFWAPAHIPLENRCAMLKDWRKRLMGLLEEAPLSFTPTECFDAEKGFQLRPEFHEKYGSKDSGLTVGKRMEKSPADHMKSGV